MAENPSRSKEVLPTIGYELQPADGGYNPAGDYCGDYWPPSAPYCPKCESLVDFDYFSTNVKVRGNWDIVDADRRTIVNDRFRDFCIRAGTSADDFRLVNAKRRLFEIWPQRVLEVDLERSQPQFGEFCTKCGSFNECIFGPGPFLANVVAPLKDGFYRTDLMFGGKMGKAPVIIANTAS